MKITISVLITIILMILGVNVILLALSLGFVYLIVSLLWGDYEI